MEIYDVTRTRVKEDPTRSFRLNQHNLWKQLAIEHNESISGSWVPRCWPMLMLLWTKPTRNVPINPVGTREHEEITTPNMCTITNSSDSWIAPIVHTTNGEVIADRTSVLFTFFCACCLRAFPFPVWTYAGGVDFEEREYWNHWVFERFSPHQSKIFTEFSHVFTLDLLYSWARNSKNQLLEIQGI